MRAYSVDTMEFTFDETKFKLKSLIINDEIDLSLNDIIMFDDDGDDINIKIIRNEAEYIIKSKFYPKLKLKDDKFRTISKPIGILKSITDVMIRDKKIESLFN